jgi:hypothetical protein
MTPPVAIYVRRIAVAAVFAGAAAVSSSAVGEPAPACAEPREWDVGE